MKETRELLIFFEIRPSKSKPAIRSFRVSDFGTATGRENRSGLRRTDGVRRTRSGEKEARIMEEGARPV